MISTAFLTSDSSCTSPFIPWLRRLCSLTSPLIPWLWSYFAICYPRNLRLQPPATSNYEWTTELSNVFVLCSMWRTVAKACVPNSWAWPQVFVYCSTCSRSFTKLKSFRKHKSRSRECSSQIGQNSRSSTPHAPIPDKKTLSTSDHCPERPSDLSVSPCRPIHASTKWQADYILSIKEQAIDAVLSSTNSLVDTLLQMF